MNLVYIGLGANLNQPLLQLRGALDALQQHAAISMLHVSRFYASKPMGPQDQPDYVNAVASFQTQLDAEATLDVLQQIELDYGRERKDERWGPRTLDLDILLFNDQNIQTERLTVPHYGMKAREFVIYPLCDIAPNLTLPCGTLIQHLKEQLPANGMVPISA
ncbi:2-amino-4-hydroxy-6-hydroxymethyldihydropteridinepyrophosphokinase [Pseudoalteromonas luteoviolacea B = ATCC 29581]|nr:2-amino-4-hydroxy-6-hydroxymethyldihydropteridinepyrophosphokinase [Pseudoalteromonas luteoviolacea B = ATCC 29581]